MWIPSQPTGPKVRVKQGRMSIFWLNYRSTNYNPEEEDLGGRLFVLMAFVTNTEQNVTAGSDGVEHM